MKILISSALLGSFLMASVCAVSGTTNQSLETMLPQVMRNIFNKVGFKELLTLKSVSKQFQKLLENPEFWESYTLDVKSGSRKASIVCELRDSRTREVTEMRGLLKPEISKLPIPLNSLSINNIGWRNVKNIINKLDLKSLNRLYLVIKGLNAKGARELAPELEKLTKLTVLRLGDDQNLGDCFVAGKVLSLEEFNNPVPPDLSDDQEDLSDSQADRKLGISEAIPALGKLTQLKKLSLGHNNLEGPEVEALASVLEKLTQLNGLYLGNSNLGDPEIKALAPALGKLTQLKDLNLSENYFKNEGIKELVPALENLLQLTYLNLTFNLLRTEEIRALAPALGKLTELTYLDLSYGGVTEAEVSLLIPELRKLQNLTYLDLTSIGLFRKFESTAIRDFLLNH